MNKVKQRQLSKKGWKLGTAEDFLELSAEEAAYVEMKVMLSRKLKEQRIRKHLNQTQLAKLINSSQSRVAKMEAGDPTVTIDLLIKSLLAMGASIKDVAQSFVVRAA